MKCKIIIAIIYLFALIITLIAIVLSSFALPFLIIDKIFGTGNSFNATREEYWNETIERFYKDYIEIIGINCND